MIQPQACVLSALCSPAHLHPGASGLDDVCDDSLLMRHLLKVAFSVQRFSTAHAHHTSLHIIACCPRVQGLWLRRDRRSLRAVPSRSLVALPFPLPGQLPSPHCPTPNPALTSQPAGCARGPLGRREQSWPAPADGTASAAHASRSDRPEWPCERKPKQVRRHSGRTESGAHDSCATVSSDMAKRISVSLTSFM